MVEVKEICADWADEPPLVYLVEALVRGFAGNPKPKTKEITDEDIGQVAWESGGRLPVVRKDPSWKATPIFDLDEMRRKNAERVKKRVGN